MKNILKLSVLILVALLATVTTASATSGESNTDVNIFSKLMNYFTNDSKMEQRLLGRKKQNNVGKNVWVPKPNHKIWQPARKDNRCGKKFNWASCSPTVGSKTSLCCNVKLGQCGNTKRFCQKKFGGVNFKGLFTKKPQLKYNCRTKEIWTKDKKKYCCVTEKVGCVEMLSKPLVPIVPIIQIEKPFLNLKPIVNEKKKNDNDNTMTYNCKTREMWNDDKKKYCCVNKGARCTPTLLKPIIEQLTLPDLLTFIVHIIDNVNNSGNSNSVDIDAQKPIILKPIAPILQIENPILDFKPIVELPSPKPERPIYHGTACEFNRPGYYINSSNDCVKTRKANIRVHTFQSSNISLNTSQKLKNDAEVKKKIYEYFELTNQAYQKAGLQFNVESIVKTIVPKDIEEKMAKVEGNAIKVYRDLIKLQKKDALQDGFDIYVLNKFQGLRGVTTGMPGIKKKKKIAIVGLYAKRTFDDIERARVWTHELGHVLSLPHPECVEEFGDNLMMSGTCGKIAHPKRTNLDDEQIEKINQYIQNNNKSFY